MKENPWARLLAYVTGLINQELLLKNEYLAAENRILRAHLPARLRLSNSERSTLAEVGKRLIQSHLACVGGDRLLHGRGSQLARAGDVLRLVLHPSGEPPRQFGRDHAAPGSSMDATNGTQRDRGGVGIPGSAAVRIA